MHAALPYEIEAHVEDAAAGAEVGHVRPLGDGLRMEPLDLLVVDPVALPVRARHHHFAQSQGDGDPEHRHPEHRGEDAREGESGGPHRGQLSELVELAERQEGGEQQRHRQHPHHHLGGAIDIEAEHQIDRGPVVEEHVDLLEDVHHHEDGDEAKQSQRQVGEELA